ncbi:head GIN domain-containing protein [Flavobacterium sp. C4GT6]|uniref:head GIN domain-containing protein n=1 Tax=Flavobacterium sp. C4GT6 TaxID=3103818 RepID=UPI002ED2F125
MTKIITHITKAVIAIVTALLFSSCGFGINGDGNVVTTERNADGNFTSVSGNRGLEVVIEQGNPKKITVEADENLQEHISTKIEGSELVITTDVGIQKATSKKVIVTMPVIERIASSSGANIISKNTIKSENLGLSSSSGSQLEVSAEAVNVRAESSSGSSLKVKGKAQKLEADASSGSNINAKDLAVNAANAEASSGSTVLVNTSNSLDAEASSGGSVLFAGNPATVNKNTSSGGTVKQD